MSSVCGLDCRLGKGLRNTVVALNKNLCCHVAEQQAVLTKSDISAVRMKGHEARVRVNVSACWIKTSE